MAAADERALHRAIKEQSFAPVYYLHGEDDYLKDAAVRQLVDAVVDPATRDFNLETRRGAEVTAEAVEVLLNTPPMMAERRAVVIRDVGALKKDARQTLDRYLARPAADTVAVLVAVAGGKPDKGLAEHAVAVDFPPLTSQRVPRWITHHAKAELGVTITPAAAELLQSAVGDELPQLAAELDKLASFTNGAEIDEVAVSEVVGVRRGETLGDLLDRVGQRDAPAALDLVDHVLGQPKMSGVQLVMALTVQTLALAWGRASRDAGMAAGRLEGEYFSFLKENPSAYVGRPWGEAVKGWARAVDRWTPEALDRALETLLAADVALKETRLSSEEQVVSSLVLTLCAGEARAA